jgi:hypothetical protein
VGQTGTASKGGNGGDGISNSITGTATTYAGGGGGGIFTGGPTAGTGGAGGGGNGSVAGSNATSGLANYGGGGGGSGSSVGTVGAGGAGVVILKYSASFTATVSGGLTSSTPAPSGGYKITTFTAGTGTVTFN